MLLIGQELGPFRIEKELGCGAMGTVYGGIYNKTGLRVAIKVMLPNMATNEQSLRRFQREAEILKQFDHPNIVRIYAVGKHQGLRYYAMELIKGESIDHILERRGRLSWEEVVELGQQLCSALQHSHEKGVIHRDLKPSNLMILRDGSLKLTDFGIAKDLDLTQLTEANCTVGTASYMSPEQCRGEQNLTNKSDLYSLGIVFYELITGKKPFVAENVMDMFMAHVQGPFERPSRLVPDIPNWLDTLICQMMEKKPEHRPLDAEKVADSLGSVMQKHEAQKSAGLDMAQQRWADLPTSRHGAVEADDREAAQTLLAGKRKRRKKKKKKKPPFYQSLWFQIVGALSILAFMGLVIYLVFLKAPAADKLYTRAQAVMKSKDMEQWYRARSDRGVFAEYFKHYGGGQDDDPNREKQMQIWVDEIDIRLNEIQLEKLLRQSRKGITVNLEDAHLKQAFEAVKEEDRGRLSEATEEWEKLQEQVSKGLGRAWGLLARNHIQMIKQVTTTEALLKQRLRQTHSQRVEEKIDHPSKRQAFQAVRFEQFGDIFEARNIWEILKEDLRDKPEDRLWFLMAAFKHNRLKAHLPKLEASKTESEFRKELVEKKLATAKAIQSQTVLGAMAICMDIMALYGAEEKLAPMVKVAKDLFTKLNR